MNVNMERITAAKHKYNQVDSCCTYIYAPTQLEYCGLGVKTSSSIEHVIF